MQSVDISALIKGTESVLVQDIEIAEIPEYFTGIRVETPFTLNLNAESKEGYVKVSVSAEITYSADCARCGQNVSNTQIYSYEWDIEDDPSDQDCLIRNGRLETDSLVDEMLYMNLPSVVLCKEDCKGLCQKCGKNLNQGLCDCGPDIDPRLTAFAKFLS